MADEKDLKNIENEKISPEEQKAKQEAFIKEFMEKNTKELAIPAISEGYKKEVYLIVNELDKIKREVEEKITSFVDLYKIIEKKLEELSTTGHVEIKEDDYKKSKDIFIKYENFLNQILGELLGELSFYSSLIAEKPLETIRVLKDVPDDASLYLLEKLKSTKKYIKNMLKDLRMSYSRYFVGFEEQIRKLDYMIAYLKASHSKK
ncbi:hypothetical protein KJ644_04375 [Candidatus Dependentiae bacterium]|nr:hypothetical protein [Candidatus Dependentiae bacterium]MBU4387675.1 hypothetical protein [Candidatus Dependentiae bacterium]MCG2756621.1 hypothetical protein [Candidatus Dependentiae bacterium]